MNPDQNQADSLLPEVPQVFPSSVKPAQDQTNTAAAVPRPLLRKGQKAMSDIAPERKSRPEPKIAEVPKEKAVAPDTEPKSPSPNPENVKKSVLAVGSVIVFVLLLASLTFYLIVFVFGIPSKVTESSLISGGVEDTSVLYPRQWRPVTVNGIAGYGNLQGKDGSSSAAIFVKKGPYVQENLSKSDGNSLATLRSTIMKTSNDSYATTDLKFAGNCKDIKDIKTTEDATVNEHSVDISVSKAACSCEGENFNASYNTLIGDDGYARAIMLVATEDQWKQNGSVFNKMLNSADQE